MLLLLPSGAASSGRGGDGILMRNASKPCGGNWEAIMVGKNGSGVVVGVSLRADKADNTAMFYGKGNSYVEKRPLGKPVHSFD